MAYIIVRILLPIYFIMMAAMSIELIGDTVFSRKKKKIKTFLLRLLLIFIWPIALVNGKGRETLTKHYKFFTRK